MGGPHFPQNIESYSGFVYPDLERLFAFGKILRSIKLLDDTSQLPYFFLKHLSGLVSLSSFLTYCLEKNEKEVRRVCCTLFCEEQF